MSLTGGLEMTFSKRFISKFGVTAVVAIGAAGLASASDFDAGASDPVTMGWMQGSPVPEEKLIRFKDGGHYTFPKTRWSFSNFRHFGPTRNIWRGRDDPSRLKFRKHSSIDKIKFYPMNSDNLMTWEESLGVNYTDSILVMHQGKIAYEKYFGAASAQKPHISFSVTKSYFGTMIAMLMEEGKVDENAVVTTYLPELGGSAFGDATVRQLLDMTTGILYSEDYTDPNAEIFKFAFAGGFLPTPKNYDGPDNFYDFLKTLKKEGEHGEKFKYQSVNTEVLGWIIKRVTGAPAEKMFSERIWQKIGAEEDAYIMVDSNGTGFAAGGLNTTLRDHARFGEMMRLYGKYNGEQIVPKSVIENIRKGGKKSDFSQAGYKTLPGWSYRDQWWVSHNENGAFTARGIHGQAIYIDPAAEMVIVRFASHPMAANANFDATSLPAFQAVADYLSKRR